MVSTARIDRRRFLAGAAVAAFGAATGCSGEDETASTTSLPAPLAGPKAGKVVVVGGGLAGLVAAWELQADNWDVVVLEASDRLGGRVRTERKGFASGQYAEAGAEFIQPDHHSVLDLAADLALPTTEVGDSGTDTVVTPTGPVPTAAFLATENGAVGADLARWDALLVEMSQGIDTEDPTSAPNAVELDAQPVSALLDAAVLHPGARFLVERGLGRRYGAAPASISLLFLLQQTALAGATPGPDAASRRVAGGTDRLVARLTEDLAVTAEVTTAAAASLIDQSGPDVRVVHAKGEAVADRVVCAAPLSVLGRIQFSPPPPPGLIAAESLAYGSAVTTLLQFGARPWEPLGLSGNAVTTTTVGEIWAAAENQPGKNGILACLSSAADAALVGAQGEEVRVGTAAAAVDSFVPGATAGLDAATSVVWHATEHLAGTNVLFGTGQVVPLWNVLRRPHGRVHFAGEHTDAWVATMEGAVRSGRRAAREVREAPRRS